MKKFIVLAGPQQYPNGWGDYSGSFNTLIEAQKVGEEYCQRRTYGSWYEVVDTDSEIVVKSGFTYDA